MSSVRVTGGILGAAILVFAWSIGKELAFGPLQVAPLAGWPTPAVSQRDREAARSGPLIDRYGNELERAVSDYRLDYRGDLYERHSPQTDVPRLKPPVG